MEDLRLQAEAILKKYEKHFPSMVGVDEDVNEVRIYAADGSDMIPGCVVQELLTLGYAYVHYSPYRERCEFVLFRVRRG